jgi:hypothetical protein
MTLQELALIAVVASSVSVLLLVLWSLRVRGRLSDLRSRPLHPLDPGSPRMDPGERLASAVAERVEDLAKRILLKRGYAGVDDLDFATGPDGSLQIWIGDQVYDQLDEIPEPAVREAVQEAVEQINQ